LHFAPLRLLQGEVDRLLVQGLRLPLNLTGEGPLLGRLQPLLGEGGEAPAVWRSPLPEDPPTLAAVTLEDAHLLLNTQRGLLPLMVNGELAPGATDARDRLRLTFAGEGPVGLEVDGRIEAALVKLRPQELRAEVDLDWQQRGSGSLLLVA